MKKYFSIAFAVLVLLSSDKVSAQKTKNPGPPPFTSADSKQQMLQQYQSTYKLAIAYGDYTSATYAVYGVLSIDTNVIAWKDTLAGLFFARGAYDQTIKVATEVYSKQPENLRILELLAVSEQSRGNGKDALTYYESLYPKTKDLYHLYQIIVIQYQLKRLSECNANIELMLNDPNSAKEQITISVGQNANQKVYYKAAAYNIRGVLARDLKEDAVALDAFNQALKLNPEFILPKANLDDMNKQSKTPTPPVNDGTAPKQ